jgi:AcrR family transcriptional regulator
MKSIANKETRRYRSPLRTRQAGDTRARILEAALRVMADGFARVSIPAVAREADVSVPTVYRHFRTKTDLLAGLYPHIVRRAGLEDLTPPRTLAEVGDGVRRYLGHIDSFDDLARAAMASPASAEARHDSVAKRLVSFTPLIDSIQPPLTPADRDRILRLLVILTSSAALRMWREHLAASIDETADDIEWIVRAAVANANPAVAAADAARRR